MYTKTVGASRSFLLKSQGPECCVAPKTQGFRFIIRNSKKFMLFDLKVLNSVLDELEQERGIPKDKVIEAIEHAFAAAYKKEYGRKGQIIRAQFNPETGDVSFSQIKIVVDESTVYMPEEELSDEEKREKTRFNPEHHIMIEDARRIKGDVELDEEIEFPLEAKEDFGRIAAQTAKQVIVQKIRAAEREATIKEFGAKEGEVVSGHVQRFERGNLYVDLGRAVAVLPYEEQIPGERYRQGERVRALLYNIDPEARGAFIKLSRTRPEFLVELFKQEAPELASGSVEVKAVAREAGHRSKIAVWSDDDRIDPVGSLVGQRGVRVSTVTSELGGEKIDIVEWTDDPADMIARALSPAEVLDVEINEDKKEAHVEVAEDQQSLAIGRGGQNVRLAAKLTGWKIDIHSVSGDKLAVSDGEDTELLQQEFVRNESVEESDSASLQDESKKEGSESDSELDIPLATEKQDNNQNAAPDDLKKENEEDSADSSDSLEITEDETVQEEANESEIESVNEKTE
jgi:N utilization substance protein A